MDGVIASFVKKLAESREKETVSQEQIQALQLVITDAEAQNTILKGGLTLSSLPSTLSHIY